MSSDAGVSRRDPPDWLPSGDLESQVEDRGLAPEEKSRIDESDEVEDGEIDRRPGSGLLYADFHNGWHSSFIHTVHPYSRHPTNAL